MKTRALFALFGFTLTFGCSALRSPQPPDDIHDRISKARDAALVCITYAYDNNMQLPESWSDTSHQKAIIHGRLSDADYERFKIVAKGSLEGKSVSDTLLEEISPDNKGWRVIASISGSVVSVKE